MGQSGFERETMINQTMNMRVDCEPAHKGGQKPSLETTWFGVCLQLVDRIFPQVAAVAAVIFGGLGSIHPIYGVESQIGVCAKVRLNLTQDAVMTRTAFRARLELTNDDPAISLQSIGVRVEITDSGGSEQADRFQIRAPELVNLSGVDGSGNLAPQSSGSATWIIVPNDTAARAAPTEYWVGGLLSYSQEGRAVSIPLERVKITVHPDAALDIHYFLQRDVYADDPFTEVVEPSVPFTLAVLVQNNGAGAAKSLTLSSAQPKIVDNEKGLQVDFRMVATELDGQLLPTSSSINFGTVEPGEISIARWLMTSTLQGLFTEYKASFEHVDGLGDPRVSLIKSVAIHPMNHLVEALGARRDGRPDFLVSDLTDEADLPDTIYLSDGSREPVSVITEGSVDAPPSAEAREVELAFDPEDGWGYLRLPEPSGGQMTLSRAVRSDGLEIPVGVNVWATDRTFVGMGKPAVYENILHLLDYNSTGAYTLYYEPLAAPDLAAPQSAVAALASSSDPQIPVQWSGSDGAGQGIAFFDVFVSMDNGPFLPWVTKSTLPGALYTGEPGHHYAFYSVATDFAGNREAAPASADTQTTVGAGNTAPILDPISAQTISEGETLQLTIHATDNDLVGNVLTYTLEPGAPIGVVLHPATGVLIWPTGETHGGATATIGVRATDNGVPPLSDVESFIVTILEQNTPPQLDPILNVIVAPDTLVSFTAVASDADAPLQARTFSLDPGAPAAATIDPVTGQFSWTPTLADAGNHAITVRVTDAGQPPLDDAETFQVRVERPNTPPSIVGVPPLTAEPGQLYTFAFEVIDAEGDAFTIATPVKPAWLSLISTGPATAKLEGTPAAADVGHHPVTVTASDGQASSQQSFVVAVQVVQHPPVAVADDYTLPEDTLLEIELPGVLENDTDEDNDPLTAELVDEPAHGTLVFREDGSFDYTPAANFHGDDSFTYRASDGERFSEVTTVALKVNPVPETPVITWPAPSPIVYGTPLSESQLNAAADLPGTFVYQPPIGTVLHAGLGQTLTAEFTPHDLVEHRPASASTTLDVLPAPLAITALDRTKLYGAPLPAFAYKIEGLISPDTESVLTAPVSFGTTASAASPVGLYDIVPSGTAAADYEITFTPGKLRIQPASLTIWAEDKSRYYLQPNPAFTALYEGLQLSESPSVLLTPALFSTSADENSQPGKYPINVSGATAQNYVIDFMPGELTVALPPPPVIEFSRSQLTYEEDAGWIYLDDQATVRFDGAPSFAGWTLQLGLHEATPTESIDLDPLPGSLILGASNDLLAENQTIGQLTSDPSDSHTLVIQFTASATLAHIQEALRGVVYRETSQNPAPVPRVFEAVLEASFPLNTGQDHLQILRQGINDAPSVEDESASVDAGRTSSFSLAGLLANDADPEGDALAILAVISPSRQGGTVQLDSAQLHYTPKAGFTGADEVQYIVSDIFGAETAGVLHLTVRPVNRPPIPQPDSAGTLVNKPIAIDASKLLLNDADPEGQALSVVAISSVSAKGGTAQLASGVINYMPPLNFTGQDSFTYTVADTDNAQATSTVAVTVAASFTLAPTSLTPQPDGSLLVRFIGRPRLNHLVQASDDGQNWTTLGNQTAAINGAFAYTDRTSPRPATRAYRAVLP